MASEMSAKLDPELLTQIDDLRDGEIRQVAPDEIVRVVQKIIDGMNSDIPSLELAVRTDLEALADYIQVTKSDIMSIDPEGIPDEHLPVATVELDAIVRATEEATNTIMESAEEIERIAASLDNDKNEALINATTRIFEACGFQDITGQRISKVVSALQEIEGKIESLLEIFGDNDPAAREDRRRKRADQREKGKEDSLEEVDDRDLLQGPQLPENAIGQDDIDALFTSMD
jgi:chemotaxis protein CheZ